MKARLCAFLMSAAMCMCLFSGCSLSIKNPENLMSPPGLTGDYRDLQNVFISNVNGKSDYVIPANGDNKSAFIIDDFNSDGKKDAVVFYCPKEGDGKARIGIFRKDGGKWEYIKNIPGAGNSIDNLIIEDFNGDGTKEIAVGWDIYTSIKQVSVYEPDDKGGKEFFRELDSYQYNIIKKVDINSDKKKELFFISLDVTEAVHSANAYVVSLNNKGETVVLDKTPVDGNVSGYSAVYVDSVDNKPVILVDAYKNEHDMITEIIMWKSGKLSAPLFDSETQTTLATWRNCRKPAADFDSDGHYEIPVGVEISGSEVVRGGELQKESLYYTLWSEFNGKKLKSEKYMIYNDNENYQIDIPSSWVGKITVNSLDSQLYFYRWNKSEKQPLGNQLFSIVSHATGSAGLDGYHSILDYNGKEYEYNITLDGEDFGIKDEYFKTSFSIIINNQGGIKDE